MLYELPHGGTVRIPDELYCKLSDQEFLDYLANAKAYDIEDPFYDSALEDHGSKVSIDDFELPEIEELPTDYKEED